MLNMAMKVYQNGDVCEIDKSGQPLLQIPLQNCALSIIGTDVRVFNQLDDTISRTDDVAQIQNQAGTPIGDIYDVVKYLNVFIRSGFTNAKLDTIGTSGGGGGGEANTASNVGTGAEVFKQKTGVDLEFRKLNSNDFDVTQNVDDISIDADANMISNQPTVVPTSGMETIINDGGTLKRADVSSFLGGGGGKEPYIDDTFVNTNAINIAGRNQNQNQQHQKNQSYGVPFMFQQDVTLKQVAMTQTNSNSLGTVGYLGLYKYASKSGGNFTFDKVYQETQTFNLSGTLANSVQRITLTTSQTLEAGKIYVIAVIHADIIQTIQQLPYYKGFSYLNPSKILGTISTSTSELYRTLFTTQAPPVGGVLPSSITYTGQSNFALSRGGFYTLTLQNI